MVRSVRRPSSWLADIPCRARFEAPARAAYPSLRARRQQRRGGPVHVYDVDVVLPGGYEHRHVTIEFDHTPPSLLKVFADGPAGAGASPHRYPARGLRQLCIWHPGDPQDQRWVPEDGLLALLGMITHHLFKEAWWRESGEWLGQEYPHPPPVGGVDQAPGTEAA